MTHCERRETVSIAALEPTYYQTSEAETTGATDPDDALGRDQFLTLLVAQLKHQDPLNPLDGTDFTAQLAQFSSLEQQFAMNDNLEAIQDSLMAQESGNVLDYIGKTVKTNGNAIFAKDGQPDSGAYTLEEPADVTIHIYDDQGLEVRRLYAGWQDAGEHSIGWDGRNDAGDPVEDGIYTFEIEAMDEKYSMVSYDAYLTGEATGVIYEGGMAYLVVGDKLVAPENIVEVRQSGAAS
jgi:flagellar basal-body rod modification protein FlgD